MHSHRRILTLVFAAFVSAPLQAAAGQATFGSVETSDLILEYTAGNGEPVSVPHARASGTVSSAGINVKDGGSTELIVRAPDGTLIARGSVKDRGYYFLHRTGNSYTLAPAGLNQVSSWTTYPASLIVNTLPQDYKVDLFPHGGDTGFKAVRVTRQFDLKQAAPLSPKWSSYTAIIHHPDGTTTRQDGVALGYYHVIHLEQSTKTPTLTQLGRIPTADERKK